MDNLFSYWLHSFSVNSYLYKGASTPLEALEQMIHHKIRDFTEKSKKLRNYGKYLNIRL